MKKRIFLIVAVVLAMVLAFAACGTGDDDNGDDDTAAPPVEGQQQPETPPTGEQPEAPAPRVGIHEPIDLGGRVIRMGNWWDSFATYIFEDPDPETSADYEAAWMIRNNALRVREEWNVEFEYVNVTYDEVIPTLTANVAIGHSDIDVMHMSGHMIMNAIQGGLIHPLETIAPPGSDLMGPGIHLRPGVFYEGSYWTFNNPMYEPGGFGLGINMDLVRQLGLPNPLELWEAGTWTWEEFLNIMRLASEVPGHFGLAGHPGNWVQTLIATNDGYLVTPDGNYGLDHPHTLAAFEFVQQIWDEGLWYYDPGAGIGDWNRNFFSFLDGNSVFWPLQTWALGDITFDYHMIPWPYGPNNTSGAVRFAPWPQAYAIPVGVQDPEIVLMIWEELHSWPGPDGQWRHYQDSVNWPMAEFWHEDDVWRMLHHVGPYGREDLGLMITVAGVGFGQFVADIEGNIFDGYATPAEAAEVFRGPGQAMLDQFFRR